MTENVLVQLDAKEVRFLDELVADGLGVDRADVIRLALRELYDAHRRRRTGAAIAESYGISPQTREDIESAMANAVALSDAEPW